MTSKDIYWKIENERKKRGYSEEGFAAECGISDKTWRNYRSDPKKMRFEIAERAAKLFKVPLKEVLNGAES